MTLTGVKMAIRRAMAVKFVGGKTWLKESVRNYPELLPFGNRRALVRLHS